MATKVGGHGVKTNWSYDIITNRGEGKAPWPPTKLIKMTNRIPQTHTNIAQDDGKEHQSVQGSPEQHQHVHPEVVDVEQVRFGEEKDKDTQELCDRDPTEDRGSHVVQRRLGPLPAASHVRHKPTNNVRAELDGYTNSLCVSE